MSEPVVARRAGVFQQCDEGVFVMTSDFRSHIRSQIKPFPRVATYPTSWAGSLTFEQIYDNLAHYVTNVMKSKGIHRTNYLPDCIQHGFMALWLELVENKDFLTDKTRQQTVFFILARCKISTLRYYDDKYDSLEELMSYDWHNTWDEHTITGFSSPSNWCGAVGNLGNRHRHPNRCRANHTEARREVC
jgi:hypothetical protein